MFDGLVVLEEYFVNVGVNRPEIALEVGNESRHGCLGNGEYAANNIADPIVLPQAKETSDDPTCIREQLDRQASYMYRHQELLCQVSGSARSGEGGLDEVEGSLRTVALVTVMPIGITVP